MRVTDHRYQGEMSKFHLAVRMISHEARTGTIRTCTGFSEDRIRKIHTTYFRHGGVATVKRRRGKSPSQINAFLCSASRQSEATVLACVHKLSCPLLIIVKQKNKQKQCPQLNRDESLIRCTLHKDVCTLELYASRCMEN